MRWSIEELFSAIKYQMRLYSWYRVWKKLGSIWRSIKATVHWIFYGFCWESIWDLDRHMIDFFIERLSMFKKINVNSYSCDVENLEEWKKIIDRLIHGFEIMRSEEYALDYESVEPVYEKLENGMASVSFPRTPEQEAQMKAAWKKQADYDEETLKLFIKYFRDLWD